MGSIQRFDKRPRGSAVQRAYEYLMEGILASTLAPGSRITEEQLSQELEISRTPLREAIRRLEQENMLLRTPSGALRVPPLSDREAHQLYAVRAVLEGLVAREATVNRTDEDVHYLQKTLQKMTVLHTGGLFDELRGVGKEFHDRLYRMSGNTICAEMLESVLRRTERYRRAFLDTPVRLSCSVEEHRFILERMIAGEADEAETAMRCHVLQGSAAVVGSIAAAPAHGASHIEEFKSSERGP